MRSFDAGNPYASPQPETALASPQADGFEGDDTCVVNFELSIEDHVGAVVRQQSFAQPRWQTTSLIVAAVFLLIALAYVFLPRPEGEWPPMATVFLILVAIYLLSATPWRHRLNAPAYQKNFRQSFDEEQLGPFNLRLSGDGIEITAPHARVVRAWSGISRVEITAKYVFLWGDKSIRLFVPRRAFVTQAAFERFVALAERCVRTMGRGAPAMSQSP